MRQISKLIPGRDGDVNRAEMNNLCPYLGSWYDSSIRFTEPDQGNRCYARFSKIRRFWIFRKRKAGVWIEMDLQRSVCYDNYDNCRYFKNMSMREETFLVEPILADTVS